MARSRRYGKTVTLAALALAMAGAPTRALAAPPPTGAGTAAALRALERAADDARSLDPASVQHRYDVAREITGGLAGLTPARPCRPLAKALGAAAGASVRAAEAFDRRDERARRAAERRVRAGLADARRARASCPGGIRATGVPEPRPPRLLLAPRAREAFFGTVRIAVAPGTRSIELRREGRLVLRRDDPPAGLLELWLPASSTAGRGTLEVVQRGPAGTMRGRSEGTWLLPPSAAHPATRARPDRGLETRLARIASTFDGYAGIYVHDLATGRTGAWNAEARFPAASTVKLGVLAAALERLGPDGGDGRYIHDLRALAAWSSNLAANRLLRALGAGNEAKGARVVETVLHRLGASRSTYPGSYRVGTSHASSPPAVSARTTSALDLGRLLTTLHAAAAGNRDAQSSSGLSEREARVAIGLLLDSRPSGDNAGLFGPWLPPGLPVAQKHGWISSARHSAGIVYGTRGPVVVVLLTYREGLDLAEAQALGRRVVRASLR